MCMCLNWKSKGYGPPTPREIRHFYTLRQSCHGGTYFFLSSVVENWIPEGAVNPGQVEISSDEKKKGFIWGFPTSNKRWKNSWFFVSGAWGRDVSANVRRNLSVGRVPRHFTYLDFWSKAIPALLDDEISHLAAAAVLPLAERGQSFLLDKERMITQRIFSRLPARLPRPRTVKNSEVASQRHAAGLAKEGISSPDGGDYLDGEDAGDRLRRGAKLGQLHVRQEAAASTPVVKAKRSDLNPRASRGKCPVKSTPDQAIRPTKRASRVVRYVVSFDEENADEPVLSGTIPMGNVAPEVPTEGVIVTVLLCILSQPRPSGQPGPSTQPGTSTPATDSRVAREGPHEGSVEAGVGTRSQRTIGACENMPPFWQPKIFLLRNLNIQQLAQLRESADGFLSAQLAVEEKLYATEEEIRSLKQQLLASQDSLAARFEAERLAEEAKEKAKQESQDLHNQLSSRDAIFGDLKIELEAQAVDRFKRSPIYDALLLHEFECGMRQLKKFFAMKDHSNEKALRRFDKSL
ncbi:hypothetical protein Q3G72_003274 [Acer saccharum]|nr:hypothetical protein Q3G72_003274 [Acer saccharum]